MIEPIQQRRIYRQIAERLGNMIRAGEFDVGSYLPPERDLAARFRVSRSSVREALIALEVQGIVSVRVGDGVKVLRLSDASRPTGTQQRPALDPELAAGLEIGTEIPPFALLQARRLVEPEAAALAAQSATNAQLRAIAQALERNRRDNHLGSKTHVGDRLFHIRIASASGNPAYELLMLELLGRGYGELFTRLQSLYSSRDMPQRSEREHQNIWEAVSARDPRAARGAMQRHLDSVIDIFAREVDVAD